MKKHIKDFFHRGLVSCGFGPMVLAVIYLALQRQGLVQDISVNQACLGIFSTTALAFIAGAMNTIYQMEKLPLMVAIAIHGVVLYVSYLVTYLLNDWLVISMIPILVFSIIFVVGYLVIWAIIYSSIKKKTERINEMLNMKRKSQA